MCVMFDGCNYVSFGVRCGFLSCWHIHTVQYTLIHACQITLVLARRHLYLFSQVYLKSWIILLYESSSSMNSSFVILPDQFGYLLQFKYL